MERLQRPATDRYKAMLLLVVTAVMWSTAGVLIKNVRANPIVISGIRSVVAFVVILPFIRRRDLTFSAVQIAGAVFYAINMLAFVASTTLTTAANAIVLQYTAPIYVALFGYCFLKERTSAAEWLMVAAAVAGVGMFFLDELTLGGLWGNILGILTGVSFAFSILCFRKQKDGSPLGSIFLGNALTASVAAPFIFRSIPSDKPSWTALLVLGVVQLGLPYVFYAWSIKRLTALEGIMIPVIEPILNPIWVWFFIGEVPGRWALPGGLIVVCAAVGCASLRVSANKNPQEADAAAR